jgi:hypothetical protein
MSEQTPIVYQVKPEQVGGMDIMQFLRQQISHNFNGAYEIVNEQTSNRFVRGFKTPRRIVSFLVEAGGQSHSIFFDTTECLAASNVDWLGNR